MGPPVNLLCALCLRDPATGGPQTRIWNDGIEEPSRVPAAVTIANGQALCETHFRRLADWQSEVHGPLAIEALLAVMHAPADPPPPPWHP
jgi:hypothetical protein